MIVQNKKEVKVLQEGGRKLALILQILVRGVRSGVSAAELDRQAEQMIREAGGVPSFKGYKGKKDKRPYPATLCVSINDELVHALPGPDKLFKTGDMVGIDIGMKWPDVEGFFFDTAVTVGVGKISKDALRLLKGTQAALEQGLRAIRPGIKIGDLGSVIQKQLEKYKLGVVRNLAGHGVGRAVHENPLIPNFGTPGTGAELIEGMVIAVEPMATLGDGKTVLAPDGWAYKTSDGSLAAHFEHTILVTKQGAEVLT